MKATSFSPAWPRGWPPVLQHVLVFAVVFLVAWIAMQFTSVPGADWYTDFNERRYYVYPPWIAVVMWPVRTLAVQNALTLTSLSYMLWRYQARPVHYLLAFTSMPLYWNLWLGQQEYIPLLGLALLPWGLPLVALKPQIAIWGTLAWWLTQSAKWKIAAWAAAGIGLSLLVYGWWPGRLRLPVTYDTVYNLSAWHWGGVVAGVLAVGLAVAVTFRTRDLDRAMAAGALAAPYVQGNSYLLLLPAFARLSGWPLLFVWVTSWSGLAALVFGDAGRPLTALFPISLLVALTWPVHRRRPTNSEGAGA